MKKISNIKNVAEVAGVSISTISRVLNRSAEVSDELKERVYKAIEETQYTANPIASTLKSARRNQIAIVLPSLRQTYFIDIVKGISDYCFKRQVTPVILESGGEIKKEMSIIANLEKQWVDGIVLLPSTNTENEKQKEYAESLNFLSKKDSSIPVVLAEACGLNDNLDCVRADYEIAFRSLTFHLLEIGRKNIAYLSCPENTSVYGLCFDGFKKALAGYGCEVNQDLVERGNHTVLDGYYAMLRLLDKGYKIDGVVCANDQVAAGALNACREQGISLPQEIAVVGFGGVALSIITTPSISTMISPRYEIGENAGRLLFERIDGFKGEARHVVLSAHLAIRESTLKTASKKIDVMFSE